MAQPRIACELIVYGARWQTDLAGVAREIARAGYDGIESGNLSPGYTSEQVSALMAEAGLELMDVHLGYGDVADPERLRAAMDFACAVGSRYLTCSGVAPGGGIQAYERSAETFNAAGRACRERGLVFCYHNHAWEFESFDGVKGIHHLAELTDPTLVKLCVDVYWVHIGKEDPAQFIGRYGDRIGYYHIKDGGEGYFSELGQGTVDLKSAVQAALRTNPGWLVYEQDQTAKTPEEAVLESRQYLRDTFGL